MLFVPQQKKTKADAAASKPIPKKVYYLPFSLPHFISRELLATFFLPHFLISSLFHLDYRSCCPPCCAQTKTLIKGGESGAQKKTRLDVCARKHPYLYLFLSFSLSLFLSFYLAIFLSFYLSFFLSSFLSIFLSCLKLASLSFCFQVCL